MFVSICGPCEMGDHANHKQIITAAPEGVRRRMPLSGRYGAPMSDIHTIVTYHHADLACWFADCKCGWRSKGHDSIEGATRAGDGHHVERQVA